MRIEVCRYYSSSLSVYATSQDLVLCSSVACRRISRPATSLELYSSEPPLCPSLVSQCLIPSGHPLSPWPSDPKATGQIRLKPYLFASQSRVATYPFNPSQHMCIVGHYIIIQVRVLADMSILSSPHQPKQKPSCHIIIHVVATSSSHLSLPHRNLADVSSYQKSPNQLSSLQSDLF